MIPQKSGERGHARDPERRRAEAEDVDDEDRRHAAEDVGVDDRERAEREEDGAGQAPQRGDPQRGDEDHDLGDQEDAGR